MKQSDSYPPVVKKRCPKCRAKVKVDTTRVWADCHDCGFKWSANEKPRRRA